MPALIKPVLGYAVNALAEFQRLIAAAGRKKEVQNRAETASYPAEINFSELRSIRENCIIFKKPFFLFVEIRIDIKDRHLSVL